MFKLSSNSVRHFLESSYQIFMSLSDCSQDIQTACNNYDIAVTIFENEYTKKSYQLVRKSPIRFLDFPETVSSKKF